MLMMESHKSESVCINEAEVNGLSEGVARLTLINLYRGSVAGEGGRGVMRRGEGREQDGLRGKV